MFEKIKEAKATIVVSDVYKQGQKILINVFLILFSIFLLKKLIL